MNKTSVILTIITWLKDDFRRLPDFGLLAAHNRLKLQTIFQVYSELQMFTKDLWWVSVSFSGFKK